ncbi:phosphatidate cytidylyltransferase [Arsenicibacter rosenii]|uniref:Phosphatidate cytidylyltransferase n=1 Tax=Arsenicibacter rosenii TaxID=1750698 RepID=A0A1S2VC18_9BACT|nr:phosphatidate cytidylyltransferase [Arsenicibacter rosenii]OIN55960.1 phosphatidate cytidylyltransferase [Arsenicibacter rosenii]
MKQRLANLSNLQQRIVAAIAGIFLILGAIMYADWSFVLLFCAISALTQIEFYRLLGLDGNQPLTFYGTVVGCFICLLTFFIEKEFIPHDTYFLICPVASMVFLIKLYKKKDMKPFTNIGFTFLGIIYVAVPFALLNVLALRGGSYHPKIILGCLLLLWASDIGAYFAGTKFGRRKLFERVSPKKSWEGSLGGAAMAAIIAFILTIYAPDLKPWQWYCVGGIIVVTGTYGDLVESLFKRSIAIKDSGSSIPGHGGFLDRFDGLLLAAPFIITFLKLFA